jgi:hypothetical protein
MKNKMGDVRDHLVAMLEALGDADVKPDIIERAKATALVANTYITAVRTEIDALRLADEIGQLPAAIEAAKRIDGTQAILQIGRRVNA